MNWPVRAAAALAGVWVLAAGCGDDLLNPGNRTVLEGTAILSPVADPNQAPIFDLGIGVHFQVENAGPSRFPLATPSPRAITLAPPYPNPSVNPEGTPVTVVVASDTAVPARVEVWSTEAVFSGAVAFLEEDGLDAGANTYTWNGRDPAGLRVPNGLYEVRVTPEDADVVAMPVLINRSVVDVIALDAFNTYTDVDGFFQLIDLPVGQTFIRATDTGQALGQARVGTRLTLFTCDVDFRHFETEVRLAPTEIARITLELVPVDPAAAGFPETARKAEHP